MFKRALRPIALVCTLACFACGKDDAMPCCDADCSVGPLSDSNYCGDSGEDCIPLASLSQGCIGSHTEQACNALEGNFTRVGGDDAADLYFNDAGELAAVRSISADDIATCEKWFGMDLSKCFEVGKAVQVECDGSGDGR